MIFAKEQKRVKRDSNEIPIKHQKKSNKKMKIKHFWKKKKIVEKYHKLTSNIAISISFERYSEG